ncbi:bacteriohemerythrin [Pseudomonadota bacterium]
MNIKVGGQPPILWVAILTLGIAGTLLYSFYKEHSIAERYTPQMDATMEIQLKVTTAHLWLEEIMEGDREVDAKEIWDNLDSAEWYARAMLEGGKAPEGRFTLIKEPELRHRIEQMLNGIDIFRSLARERIDNQSKAGIGSNIEQHFDNIFSDTLASAKASRNTLLQLRQKQFQRLHFIQGVLVLLIITLGTFVFILFKRYEQQRTGNMRALQKGDIKLSKTNRLYATQSQVNQAIVRARNKQELFQGICDIAIEYGQFRLAWIGLIDNDKKEITPIAFSGWGTDYLKNIKISITDELTSKGPTGRAIREKKSVVFNDLEHNPDYAPWRNIAMEQGYRSSGAFPIRLHDSVVGTINIYAAEPDFFDRDEIALLEEVALDISFALENLGNEAERKKAEQRATRFGKLLEDSLDEIYIFDSRTLRFTDVNLGARQNLGYTLSELKQLTPLDLNPKFTAEYFNEIVAPLRYRSEEKVIFTTIHHRKDGSQYPVELHLQLMPDDPPVFVSIAQDIAARRETEDALHESEIKFRSIFQSTIVGMIIVINDRGLITEWNTGAVRAFGYTPDEVIGKPLTMLIPDRYKQGHEKGFERAVVRGTVLDNGKTQELSGIRKNGEEFPIELTLGSWRRKGQLYFSAIVLDITERKQTEQALRHAQKMKAVGQVTGGIAHDFNNLLCIILGNLDLLKQDITYTEKTAKRLETIISSTQRATALTKQLLGFSRRQAVQTVVTNINSVITDMESLIRRSVTPEVELSQNFAKNIWLTEIDPGDFQDALLNLVINARDAMPSGGKLIIETSNDQLDTEYCSHNPDLTPGQYVQLTVSDDGLGISPDILEHVFEPFFTTKEHGKGTGLGLAMAYGFAKRSGGHIEVFSTYGIGTTFRLYLPRASSQKLPEKPIDTHEGELPGGTETVLAVDDEEALRDLAKESLETLGYSVLTAKNGHDALACLEKNSTIDLLFTDVLMPGGINGYELAEQVTQKHPQINVLLTSGYTEKAITSETQAHFTANLLCKPYTLAELAQQTRAVLGSKKKREQSQLSQGNPKTFAKRNDDLNVGIKGIDDDHQVLLDIIDQCQRLAATNNKEKIGVILDYLNEYIQTHFDREEAVMALCNYPGLNNHRQVHQLLRQQVDKMQRQQKNSGINNKELMDFLGNWLTSHIQGMDHAFAPYCKNLDPDEINRALAEAAPPPRKLPKELQNE